MIKNTDNTKTTERKVVIKEIKAAGYYDESGQFRLLSCVGKITPVDTAAASLKSSETNKRVA